MVAVYDNWGIADGYHDVEGRWHDTPASTRQFLRAAIGSTPDSLPIWFIDEGSTHSLQGRCHLTLEDGSDRGGIDVVSPDVPIGYHRLAPMDGGPVTTLVVAPAHCLPAPRGWGVAAQVYALWRPGSWGIGDLRDVFELGREVGAAGGDAVLLSPVHAPAPTFPQEDSPYYPSSRRWLNPLLIALDGPSPVANTPDGLIDRNAVWAAKRAALVAEFSDAPLHGAWRQWANEQGDELWQFCIWHALAERLGPRWREWPEHLRRPSDLTATALDAELAADVDFHAWVQWRAAYELAATAAAASVGLIGDLAVGSSPDGADTWLHQDLMALDVRIGAPPDPFNAAGQEWGLPPFVPPRLRAAQYAPFIAMVRAACHNMAGLRIDHVMGLFRQFWVPAGAAPTDGTYVQMPYADLLAIIRLEATRAGAFVVGEDLGTVEPEVHDALRASGILGTKVWWFDPHPAEWPAENLATVTTHDLPTVAGVWAGTDGTPEMAGLLRAAVGPGDARNAAVAVHSHVGASASVLCLASLDDLAGCTERTNHPGTLGDRQPNWRRRLSATSGAIFSGTPGNDILDALMAARGPREAEER
jgi:4-alpha-glucanotransferase